MNRQDSLYQFHIKRYDRKREVIPTDYLRFEIILSLAGTRKKILDLGCGSGLLAKKLKSRKNDVVGLDISPQAIKRAKKRGLQAFVCNLEIERWPVKKNCFDVVVASEVIEHILDTDKFLKNIRRVLKAKGSLILTTPNTASLGRRLFLLLGKNPYLEASFHPQRAGHVRYFTKDSLFILLRKHGFKIKNFTSSAVVFSQSGKIFSTWLAKIWPTLGKHLIVEAIK